MNDSNYSPSLVSALKIARGMALQDKHNTFGVSHLVMYNPQNHPSTFSKRSVSILRFFSKTKRLF